MLAVACTQIVRVDTHATDVPDTAFAVTGRLSAQHAADALTANFDWQHRADADTIVLATPLGQSIARLERTDGAVTVALANGQHASADTFDALTARAFGVALPVAGLTWWIRALPRAGSAFAIERDGSGRPIVLRQDGWEVDYSYADAAATLPRRLLLAYPQIDMRVVVDQWR
ncbi:MAG: lipoprotein insertase outer membrane protein LolB [Casimicrobiaceae bacterium]